MTTITVTCHKGADPTNNKRQRFWQPPPCLREPSVTQMTHVARIGEVRDYSLRGFAHMFSLILRSFSSQNPLLNDDSSLMQRFQLNQLGARHRSSRSFHLSLARLLTILLCSMPLAVFGQSTPALINPAPGSVLGSSATFTWTAGTGITKYMLYLGTQGAGSSNLYTVQATKATSAVVSGLPQLGVTVYARLRWYKKGVWQYADYTYAEASPAPSLSSLTCTGNSITGAGTDGCTITLSAAAGSGGLAVSLASNNSAVVVPASVTVPAGAASAAFTASIAAVTTAQTATLTASAGSVSLAFALQLNSVQATLAAISCTNSSMTGSGADACTVTLSGPATGTGLVVNLSSNNSAVTVPASITVPANASSAGFSAAVSSVTTTQTATLTASAGSVSLAFALQLNPVQATLIAISCTNSSMTGSGADACTVTLSGPATGTGLVVNLSSNNSAVTVPASITVPANASSAGFSAAVSSVTTTQTATLTASAAGVSKTFAIQLNAGTPTLNINTASISFGNVTLNTTATQSITLSSAGTAAVTVSSATVAGTGFSLSGMSFPTTLNPGQNAVLNVAFNPTTSGTASGTVTISSNSSANPSAKVTLSGTGVAASYQVDLAWGPPNSSPDPVAGYNVYRAASGTGSYQLLNSSPDTQPNYVDSTVKTGQSYDYVVKSVDSSGVESTSSNSATAVIP